MPYAEVLVDVNNRRLDRSYYYRFDAAIELKPGMRVLVPLQNRKVQALVIGVTDHLPPEVLPEQVRDIAEVLDCRITVPPEMIELAQWLAETTICSLAQCLRTVWPLIKGKVEDWVVPLAAEDDPDVQAMKVLDPEMFGRLKVLYRARRHGLPLNTYLKRARISKSDLDHMVEKGWVEVTSRFVSGWSASGEKPANVECSGEQSADGFQVERHVLTPAQRRAVEEIFQGFGQGKPDIVLLHGVTGSGKTEVYRELVERALLLGKDAIVLVPEISLTGQVAAYFTAHFRDQVIVLHSALTPRQKTKAWEEILAGNKRLVIGARSAVFAPLPNLGLIIIDEEHDGAYKQDENPKYHAREVARKRIEQVKGLLVLGSATPSLETYAVAQAGKIRLVNLTQRVARRKLPAVTVVDLRQELINGNRSIFSFLLQEKLRTRLERGEQSMLFLNRRGYSTFVICRECGKAVHCPNCDVALTYHAHGQAMRCHYCNHVQPPPVSCPECGSRYIRFFGLGTQRVEEELQVLFPEARFLRMDSDTTTTPNAHEKILSAFRRQEADVLIGTQMMAKGLDFPNVTLVGVIAADQMLNFPDFRSRERTFQLLTQVAGRAGRGDKEGEVIIQTYTPYDRAVQRAARHDYRSFFWDELAYRRERNYPPFTHFLRLMLLHDVEERVLRAAQKLGHILSTKGNAQFPNIEILGPAPALIPRLNREYRWQILLKGKDLAKMRQLANEAVHRFYETADSSGINLSVEVNPLSM